VFRVTKMRYRIPILAVLMAAFSVTAGAVAIRATASGGVKALAASSGRVRPRQRPRYDPSKYTARIDNAWYPLKPRITYVYRGQDSGRRARDVLHVTDRVFPIVGVPCRVIRDKLFINGKLRETTKDYYTQDEDGNVWYFGEDTAELDRNGNVVSREGSWRTGRKGAEAGIFMEANPQVDHEFQQEFYRNHAEDHYKVLSLHAEIQVPFGHFGRNSLRGNVQLTREWTPLEPEVRDHKYYVRGIGEVKEETVRGGRERFSLVKILVR
jgi:hypothetical protein